MAVASLAAASLISLASASASAKDHADWAIDFINNVAEEDNGWATPCSIDWDAYSGKTKGACFFTLTMQKALGYTDLDTYAMWRMNSPTSDYYFDIINSSPAVGAPPPGIETHFRRVTRAIDVQKGDVLVIGATATFGGHTVIITGAPEDITDKRINPRYSGTKQYAVPIADSTETAHGCNEAYPDSRWSGACTGGYMASGAGTAYMRVYTDALTGILLGYTWSVTSSTTSYYSPSTRPYRIGRLFKMPAPIPTDPPPPPP
ncbi:hypothetical protein [Sorangium sp. So ce1389]|uniref:hypothetical protein n=1 Tax=Sorangium sp. So ce1389 TaxID=3133336 RepID=UPI003F61B3CD